MIRLYTRTVSEGTTFFDTAAGRAPLAFPKSRAISSEGVWTTLALGAKDTCSPANLGALTPSLASLP